jgi:hypothetical protein
MKTFLISKCERDNVKVWGAIITGLHPKYKFNRDFKSQRFLNDCSSKHAYYDYYIEVEENEIVECCIKSDYKHEKCFYILKDNEFKEIKEKDVYDYFQGYNLKKCKVCNNVIINKDSRCSNCNSFVGV